MKEKACGFVKKKYIYKKRILFANEILMIIWYKLQGILDNVISKFHRYPKTYQIILNLSIKIHFYAPNKIYNTSRSKYAVLNNTIYESRI